MKRVINKTKWKKIKKNYQRITQSVFLDEEEGFIYVWHHYQLKTKEG